MNEKLYELLVYMITSAAGLPGEPKTYGPLRMIEASQRLCTILKAADPDNLELDGLIALIEEGKHKNMTDTEAFNEMLQNASAKLVDCILFE